MHSLASFVVTVCICSDTRAALFKTVEEIELFVVWLFYYFANCQARKLNKEDAMDRCKWRKVIKEAR